MGGNDGVGKGVEGMARGQGLGVGHVQARPEDGGGGAVLVEAVFSWPGLGTLAFQSIIARDTPTILGILFFSALVVIVGNLLTDLVLRLVDPRVGGRK